MKVYIAGKITGNNNFREQFFKAEEYLLSLGYEVINPVRISDRLGVVDYSVYMREDIKELCGCDCIYFLSNWVESRGAMFEFIVADFLGLDKMFESIKKMKKTLDFF